MLVVFAVISLVWVVKCYCHKSKPSFIFHVRVCDEYADFVRINLKEAKQKIYLMILFFIPRFVIITGVIKPVLSKYIWSMHVTLALRSLSVSGLR